ncbi:hypothetical protein H4R34_003532 [Dimargaris verticillata]|uniref:Metalloenzyme, LuxS/M16 peptidase-like protein n=1 Tax=Dimargaris verticillata TaxID=2761393 RepID=A0A9W8B618_9FUNG|nr:hypothetical protein H4R34_003532 [Dimargaris verticillata]
MVTETMPPANAEGFALESAATLNAPAGTRSIPVHCYRHLSSGLHIIFADVVGPTCSASIVVPTLSPDNKGLPHTLEHLVFCGSTRFPHRGYLDTLANRCLSMGTNAYTEYDHTAYTIKTAGQEGMNNLLPVFLDHVLNPTLQDEQFVAEVYHVDGQGQEKGVVFSEMAAREMTESDLVCQAVREEVFGPGCAYSYECGGFTKDIATLNNQLIKDYHRRYYAIHNVTIMVIGQNLDHAAVFAQLDHRYPGLLDTPVDPIPSTRLPMHIASMDTIIQARREAAAEDPDLAAPTEDQETKTLSRTIYLPTTEESVGSFTYAWRGPPIEDVETSLALNVLFRYFTGTAASPFNQAFVENDDPWAICVDPNVVSRIEHSISLNFMGVPFKSDGDTVSDDDGSDEDMANDRDGNEPSTEQNSGENANGESGSDGSNDTEALSHQEIHPCFTPGVFRRKMRQVFQGFLDKGFPNDSVIRELIQVFRLQVCKLLEHDPHELLLDSLSVAVVEHHFSPRAATSQLMDVGVRLKMFDVFDVLEQKPLTYWYDLVRQWLIDTPMVEIIVRPDAQMATQLEQAQQGALAARVAKLGTEGLAQCQRVLDEALAANEVYVPLDLLDQMPPVPSIQNIAKRPVRTHLQSARQVLLESSDRSKASGATNLVTNDHGICGPDGASNANRPFDAVQVVETDSRFAQIRMFLPTHAVPAHLKPYLVLFAELLFRCSLQMPSTLGDFYKLVNGDGVASATNTTQDMATASDAVEVDYRDMAQHLDNDLMSYSSDIGYGGTTFNCNWLSENVTVCGDSTPEKFALMCRWLIAVVMFSDFTSERIMTSIQSLLGEIPDVIRDNWELMYAASIRMTAPQAPKHVVPYHQHQSTPVKAVSAQGSSLYDPWNNDLVSSIFQQRTFLQKTMELLSSDDPELSTSIVNDLNALRHWVVVGCQQTIDSVSAGSSLTGADSAAQQYPSGHTRTSLGLVQVGWPSFSGATETKTQAAITRAVYDVAATWDKFYQQYARCHEFATDQGAVVAANAGHDTPMQVPFPYPRFPYVPFYGCPTAFHIPHPSATSSCIISIIPCDKLQFAAPPAPDRLAQGQWYHDQLTPVLEAQLRERLAVDILTEILSKDGGPLFTQIRGNGYAYGCTFYTVNWSGELAFIIHEATAPFKAQRIFWRLIEELGTANGWAKYVNDFEFQSAKSSWTYTWVSEKATPAKVLGFELQASLWGFKDGHALEALMAQCLEKLTLDHLREAYQTVFCKFVDASDCMTLAITPPSLCDEADDVASDNPNGTPFQRVDPMSLMLGV